MKSTVLEKLVEVVLRITAQGRSYGRTFSWLIADSMGADPKLWRRMLVATAIGLGANAAAVGLIFGYVMLVERNEQVSLLGISIYPRESFLLLILAVAALLAVSLILAVSQYLAGSSAIRAMGSFAKRCSQRAIRLYRLLPDPRAQRADEILRRKKIIHLARTDANQCGMAIRMIGSSTQSLLMFLFAIGIMFLMDAKTTMIVCGLGMLVIAIQYPSNLFAADSTAVLGRTNLEVQRGLMSLLDRVSSQPRHSADEQYMARDLSRFFEKPATRDYMRATENRFRSIEVSGLTMRLGTAVILSAIILMFGVAVLRQEVEWAKLLAYLTLLRLALGNVTAIFQTVTGVTRLYPNIQDYSDFVKSASLAETPLRSNTTNTDKNTLTMHVKSTDGVSELVKLTSGTRCALMAPLYYSDEIALDFQRALGFDSGASAKSQAATVDFAVALPRSNLRKPVREQRAEMATALQYFLNNPTDVILLDRRALDIMEAGHWERWCEDLRDSVLIVIYTDRTSSVAEFGEGILFLKNVKSKELRWTLVPSDGFSKQQSRRLWRHTFAAAKTDAEEEDEGLLDA